mmetsp:Transcript_11199/g.35531  ORF Transcript_11199/g.35531 Transcript_11199/m.35531 type:complete len:263 (-) Transcript_11199:212-1000(-)
MVVPPVLVRSRLREHADDLQVPALRRDVQSGVPDVPYGPVDVCPSVAKHLCDLYVPMTSRSRQGYAAPRLHLVLGRARLTEKLHNLAVPCSTCQVQRRDAVVVCYVGPDWQPESKFHSLHVGAFDGSEQATGRSAVIRVGVRELRQHHGDRLSQSGGRAFQTLKHDVVLERSIPRLKDKALAEHVDAEHLLESLLDLEYRCRARQGQRGNDVTGHEADDVHSVLSGGALLARSTNIRLPQRFHLALLLATCGELAALHQRLL